MNVGNNDDISKLGNLKNKSGIKEMNNPPCKNVRTYNNRLADK